MRILVVAFYYPPDDSFAKIGSLRPASWFKYWTRAGHDVHVLTSSKPQVGFERCIERVDYWPRRPAAMVDATRASRASRAWGDWGHRLMRAAQRVLRTGNLLHSSNTWILPALHRAMRLHRQLPFDVVVSTYGPPANHLVAALLKQRTGIRWVADYRDLWSGNAYRPSHPLFPKVEAQLESLCVARADVMTTVSEELAHRLRTRFPVPVHVVENGFDPEDAADLVPVAWPDRKLRLLYTGTLYPGAQDPAPLFEAVRLLESTAPDRARRLEILFYGWHLESARDWVDAHRLNHIIKIGGSKPRPEILQLQRSVDALLFLDWNGSEAGVLTGKLFEYAFSGKPVLAVGSMRDSSAKRLIEQLGLGCMAGDSPQHIAALIGDLLDGRPLPYAPLMPAVQAYTRESLAAKMLSIIETGLPTRTARW